MKNKKCPERKFCFSYKDNSCEGCACGDEILKLHKRIDRLKKQNETLTIQRNAWALTAKAMENKWISVDERLPEENVRVLVWLKDDVQRYTHIDTDRRLHAIWVRWGENVTHWMPLPEPPMMKGGAQ